MKIFSINGFSPVSKAVEVPQIRFLHENYFHCFLLSAAKKQVSILSFLIKKQEWI